MCTHTHTHRNRVWIPIKVTLEPKTKCLKQKYITKTKNCVLQAISSFYKMTWISLRGENVRRQNEITPKYTVSSVSFCRMTLFSDSVLNCFVFWLKCFKRNLVKFCGFATLIQNQSSVDMFARCPKDFSVPYSKNTCMHIYVYIHVSCWCNCLFDLSAMIASVWNLPVALKRSFHHENISSEGNTWKKITMGVFKNACITEISQSDLNRFILGKKKCTFKLNCLFSFPVFFFCCIRLHPVRCSLFLCIPLMKCWQTTNAASSNELLCVCYRE